jgi:hypothetical protein
MGVKLSQTTSKIVINFGLLHIYNVPSMSSYQNYNLDNERCSKLQ